MNSCPMSQIRISTPQIEGSLQGSKQLKFQVLLDDKEMRALLNALNPVHMCIVSEPVALDRALIGQEEFLAQYDRYIAALKQGKRIDEKPLRPYFSSAWTADLNAIYAMAVGPDKYLVKPIKPLIQLQGHHFFYSSLDQKFHPMVLSQESITWGLQFSYPQLYQHPKTSVIGKVGEGEDFPNTPLFSHLTKWLREHTLPTPFVVQGKRTNSPIRLGKHCLTWIHNHPQLIEKGIEIFSFTRSV